jgi:hypothetical protein
VLTTPNAVPHTRDLQKVVLWGCFGRGNTTHRKKIGGKKTCDACHGFCRHPWQSVAHSGVTSLLATLWETLDTHGFLNLQQGVSSIVFFIDEF